MKKYIFDRRGLSDKDSAEKALAKGIMAPVKAVVLIKLRRENGMAIVFVFKLIKVILSLHLPVYLINNERTQAIFLLPAHHPEMLKVNGHLFHGHLNRTKCSDKKAAI